MSQSHSKDEQITRLQAQLAVLKQQLLQSEKLASLGQLAAGVAHEINNPIGYVSSNMKVLAEYSDSLINLVKLLSQQVDEAQRLSLLAQFDFDYVCADLPKLVQESEQGLERVVDIIHDLKDFSHIEEAEFVDADLHQGIQSTLNIVSNELKYKAEVVKDFAELPLVRCIPSQLNQVLLNLLVNAAHAIEQHGTIRISTGFDDNWVWFSVSDDGQGMDAAQLARIFEPFYTTKPKGQGTGLGLPLSRSIVEKHQGLLDVSSTLGVGSCFTVKLPRQPQL
ncbi:MAG: ATPase [Gammaproteobacteria bacterium]|nr:ATPase [Gammaproteobacteria bacterium]MBU1555033.1 ATPase [Gammaproteobacteria bacterium]MBU2069088.1 ATPase [Gammaproteobacteria bacterium]MBU2182657.1 ATPase [Gammaproteobacteria bacterium]MBU2206584.1 ATPase [Gammaproteobacteria bacterium]